VVICPEESAYGPADATVTPSSIASLKSKMVLPFWYWLTQVVLVKRLLNGYHILVLFISVHVICPDLQW